MISSKSLHIDLFFANLKAQSQNRIFEILAQETSALCMTNVEALEDVIQMRLYERSCCVGDGVAIFDVKSAIIQKPVLAISTFDQPLDFNAPDLKPVDVMAAVLSPQSHGPFHLQRLAAVSRMLRSDGLCAALREAQDTDAMQVLFMPTQEWMNAA